MGGSCDNQDLEGLAKALVTAGPISILVNAGAWDSWPLGSTNVMSATKCGSYAANSLDHAVQLVGFNRAAPQPYWIVRNQWGEDWGDHGFTYLEYGENTCGLADAPIIPILGTNPSNVNS